MPDVFVNYRTGDGDEAANILETYLTNRFGEGRIFRAVRSIHPGQQYDKGLLSAVWASRVLLAIIGPGWADHPDLKREDDWVRRELLEAREANVTIIPILKGRRAGRLQAEELPPELEWLTRLQSMILDTRDSEPYLDRIGDRVAELIPALREANAANQQAPELGPVRNDASHIDGGTVFQVGSVGGSLTSSPVSNSQGVTGSGDVHIYHEAGPRRKGSSQRKRRVDDLRELERCFVQPDGFAKAEAMLRDPLLRTVYLKGPRGSGRETAAKILLRRVGSTAETIHELVVRARDDATEPPLDPDLIDNGGLVWADLRDRNSWSWDEIRRCLPDVRHAVMERAAYLVAVLPDEAEGYEEDIEFCLAEIGQPSVAEVLARRLDRLGIPRSGELTNIAFVEDERPLQEVREYVSHITDAQDEDPKAGILAWCETAYKRLSGRDEEVAKLVQDHEKGPQRALMLAVAMLPNAHADLIESGAAHLLELTGQPECSVPRLERRPLDARLDEIKARRDPAGGVAFLERGRDAAVRTYFWAHMGELREPLRQWVTREVKSKAPPYPALIGNLVDLCLADRYQHDLLRLVADWTEADASAQAAGAAAVALQRGLRSDQARQEFRKKIYAWVREERISIQRAEVLIRVCRDVMAVQDPDAALIRLLHLARRRPGLGAEEAVIELAMEDRFLLRLTLDRLHRRRYAAARTTESRIFLGLAAPKLFTDPGRGGRRLIGEAGIREQLIRSWTATFAHVDADLWEPRAMEWLSSASANHTGTDGLLNVLATAIATQVAAAGQLYAMTRQPGFDPAVSRLLLQKITSAQLTKTAGSRSQQEPGDDL